jgi:hypothetical protein
MTEPPSSPALLPGREKGARTQSPSLPLGEGFRVRAQPTMLTIDIEFLYYAIALIRLFNMINLINLETAS